VAPAGYIVDNTDCDDNDAAVKPSATEVCNQKDDNCVGGVDEGSVCVRPEVCNGVDDDLDGEVDENLGVTTCGIGECQRTVQNCVGGKEQTCSPGTSTTEVCDGLDNDCDGQIDEGVKSTFYADNDGDTYGTTPLEACTQPQHTATRAGDCDDNDTAVNPSATEVCNQKDDNCVNGVDEGNVCAQPEVCNGIDDDLDGEVDENLGVTTCGIGECQRTVQNCVEGKPEICVSGSSSDEVCDGVDNDCDGSVDEDIALVETGTDTGECVKQIKSCVSGQMQVTQQQVLPSTEVCNGLDDDCDGSVDENIALVESGTDTGACQKEIKMCDGGVMRVTQTGISAIAEVCGNTIDDDCDGEVDEGCLQEGENQFEMSLAFSRYSTSDQVYKFNIKTYSFSDKVVHFREGDYPTAYDAQNSAPYYFFQDAINPLINQIKQDYPNDDIAFFGFRSISGMSTYAQALRQGMQLNYFAVGLGPMYPSNTKSIEEARTACKNVNFREDDTLVALELKANPSGEFPTHHYICIKTTDNSRVLLRINTPTYTTIPSTYTPPTHTWSYVLQPEPEICDGIDNDLDGQIDEGVKLTFYADNDGDTYGTTPLEACTQQPKTATRAGDCNDNDATIHPGTTEVCGNTIDDDCDGLVDEGCSVYREYVSNPGSGTTPYKYLASIRFWFNGTRASDGSVIPAPFGEIQGGRIMSVDYNGTGFVYPPGSYNYYYWDMSLYDPYRRFKFAPIAKPFSDITESDCLIVQYDGNSLVDYSTRTHVYYNRPTSWPSTFIPLSACIKTSSGLYAKIGNMRYDTGGGVPIYNNMGTLTGYAGNYITNARAHIGIWTPQ
ncbi:putative metal-binding motif-containing protein, partial [Candidatus Woesearchaeota archaeon]|nr:putative metal-binding motif-containing protein [Candidatus Woesearchaeota archaeon]